jgi:hypothetical protein
VADGGTSYLAIVSGVIGGAHELRLIPDGGPTYLFASSGLPNGFSTVVVAPGTYGVSVRNVPLNTTVTLPTPVTFTENGYQVAALIGDTFSGVSAPTASVRVMPDGGGVGVRSIAFFNGMVPNRSLAPVPMTLDVTGDGLPDTAPIAWGDSVVVDLPLTQTTVRVSHGTGWLEYQVPATQMNGYPEGSRGAIVVRGIRNTYDPALRAAVRGLSAFDAPLTFTTRTDLPNPYLQLVNLGFVNAAGMKRDLYVGSTLLMADAGYGAVSEPFSILPDTSTSFSVQPTGTTLTSMSSVGTHTLPAGAAGLVVYIDSYQLSRAIDTRSTGWGTNLDQKSGEHNVVQAYFDSGARTLQGGVLNGTTLNIYQGSITSTPFVSLAPTAFATSLTNLAIRENTTPNWRINGFSFADRIAWTFFSRLNLAGDRRFVRVSAPWAAYSTYVTDAVNVPCSQTTTACTPCAGAACACPAGVWGCN